MKVAPEGWPFIGIATGVLIAFIGAWVIYGGAWLGAAVLWLPIAVWVPWFFRNPERTGRRGDDLVIAPADGKVVSIVEVDEPDFVKGKVTRVSIFMNVFSVHVNRYPTDGIIEYRKYRPGKFVNATLDKASTDNEQMSLGLKSPGGPILVRQIAGLVARRIVTDDEPGSRVNQGERLGIIRFGSRVDTFVSPEARITVSLGDRAVAGQTVIAEWPS
jgi:phosphatidylserine decarboxylase